MRHVLLTGFPGFLAKLLSSRLATVADRLTFLVEERFLEAASGAALKIARETGKPPDRFHCVRGDITRGDLGLSESDRDLLLEEADTVFHLAAIYDLSMSLESGMKVNVGGTRNVNEFVRRMKRLERYNYISTCFVVGDREGIYGEEDFPEGRKFRNHYEETKYLAEKEVRAFLPSLPVTIFRPSVVVGDSHTGFTTKYDGPYLGMRMILRMPGALGRVNFGADHPFNVVPVDYVTDAMVAIAKRPEAVHRTFHLSDPDPIGSREIAEILCRLLRKKGTWSKAPEWLMRVAQVPPFPWILGVPRQTIPYFWARLSFDCRGTLGMLSGTSIRCPRFVDYAENLVRYYLEHPAPGT